MTERYSESPLVVGWREWVGLPLLGLAAIPAKLDTGARTCALHALEFTPFTRDGETWVRFLVPTARGATAPLLAAEAPHVDERWVRSSTGKRTLRPVIRTELQLNGERWSIELTLAQRSRLGFRLLLGREALRGRFLVDSSRSWVMGKRPV